MSDATLPIADVIEGAWRVGVMDSEAGKRWTDNPYPIGSLASRWWIRGWEYQNAEAGQCETRI